MGLIIRVMLCWVIVIVTWMLVTHLVKAPYSHIILLGAGGTIALVFAATTKKIDRMPIILRASITILGLLLLAIAAFRVPSIFPLSSRIHGGTFNEASLEKVLQHISEQKQASPYWRFEVYDDQAVETKLTISIPEQASLREAINLVCLKVGCEYEWHWHRGTDNGTPLCAIFALHRKGFPLDLRSECLLLVEGSNVAGPR